MAERYFQPNRLRKIQHSIPESQKIHRYQSKSLSQNNVFHVRLTDFPSKSGSTTVIRIEVRLFFSSHRQE